jgi:hypothetical protein
MLKRSVEEEIAAEDGEIGYISQELGEINVLIPEYSIRENLSELFKHEPPVATPKQNFGGPTMSKN